MNTFKPRAYSINDLYEWYIKEPSQLFLSPKFQRRSVWSPQYKSYLISTILMGLPLPIIFIRNSTDVQTRKINREVVDGQQRLRTIFDFIDNGFKLRNAESEKYGGYLFSELPEDIQALFLKYELSVNLLEDIDDKDVLDIFARLNSYGVKLNAQELLNAQYFGYFKQLVYKLGFSLTKFWEMNKIFTSANIMRMKEAELVSDLLVVMLDGIQSSAQISKYYKQYDDNFEEKKTIEERFFETIDIISCIYNGNFSNTRYSSPSLFYALFVVIYHENYSVKDFQFDQEKINKSNISKVRMALDEIEGILEKKEDLSAGEREFQVSCTRSTGNKNQRITRCTFMVSIINKHLDICN